MADLTKLSIDPTLAAIDAALVDANQREAKRGYLGMSSIGHPCLRKSWYNFRAVFAEIFDADTLKKFEDGHLGEDLQAKRLRMVKGIRLWTQDDDTGKQIGCADLNGHFRGHLDGVIKGILQAPKTPHVWEHKSVGETNYKSLVKLKTELDEKQVLAAWNETYFAQAQLYMHYQGLERHYLTVSTPGGRETTSVRTDYDQKVAEDMIARARYIIETDQPPERLRNDPAYYICKWCTYHAVCHEGAMPAANCRTCCRSTPVEDGKWSCAKHGEATKMCGDHLYLPSLIGAPTDGGDDWVDYNYFINVTESKYTRIDPLTSNAYTSAEMAKVKLVKNLEVPL